VNTECHVHSYRNNLWNASHIVSNNESKIQF